MEISGEMIRNAAGEVINLLILIRDITERSHLEKELGRSKAIFESVMEASPDMITITDLEGRIIYTSEMTYGFFGYDKSFQVQEHTLFDFIIPSEHEKIRHSIKGMFEGRFSQGIYTALRADGSTFPIEVNRNLIRNEKNNEINLIFVSRDITERIKIQEELFRQEESIRNIVESINDVVFEIDNKGNMVYLSPSIERMSGYKVEELQGRNFLDYVYEEDRDEVIDVFLNNQDENVVGREYRFFIKDGSMIWARINSKVLYREGVPVGRVGITYDITEFHLNHEKLLKLEKAVEQSPVSIVMTDLDGNIEYANPKMCEVTGYDLSELIGQNPRVLKSGDTPESEYDYLWKSIVDGNVWRGVFHNKRKDGSLYWESAFITPVLDSQGKVMSYLGIKEDITEQKAIQEALAKSENRFRQVAQQSRTVVWEVNSEGVYTYVNPVAEKVWGYRPEELVGKKYFYELHPKESRARFIKNTRKYFVKKIPFNNLLNPVENKKGERIWVMTSGVPMADSNGKLLGYQGSDRDVTEQIDAEQRVRESEDALNQAQEIANMGSWEYDFATDQVVWSKNMYRMLGVEQGEMEIKVETINQFIHPDDLPEHEKMIDRIFKTGEVVHSEFRFLFKDKTTKWVHNVIAPFHENKKLIKLRGIALDITNKKQQEEELIEKNVRLSAIMNATPDLVFVYDKQGVCREYYSVAGKKTALSEEYIIGSKLTDIYNKEEATIHLQKINQAIKKKNLVTYEYQMNINGKQNFFEARVKALDEKHVLIFSTDITERKLAEQKIMDLNANLEKKVIERTKQLEKVNQNLKAEVEERLSAEQESIKARKEAEQANKAKSEFLSRMSHELRTPMNSILGFAQLLDMSELDDRQTKGVHHIVKSGKHLLNLINEVLDIARIESGHISLSLEPVSVNETLDEMLAVVANQANEKKISIENVRSVLKRQDYVLADKQRMHQVILNLLNNAVKYNKTGGKIIVKTSLESQKKKKYVRISISDTGKGIAESNIDRLFNPFERIGAEKSNIEGTGLGLSVVKNLMEVMGGNYGVNSTLNEGSTFWLEFPMTDGKNAVLDHTKETIEKKKENAGISGTLLYIEDNKSNIELVDQILSSQRPAVRLIANSYGKDIVKLSREVKPSLVLLDLNLPDIHGKHVIKIMKADKELKDIPVVVISADVMPKQIDEMIKAGALDYLSKPIDIVSFLKVVDRVLTSK